MGRRAPTTGTCWSPASPWTSRPALAADSVSGTCSTCAPSTSRIETRVCRQRQQNLGRSRHSRNCRRCLQNSPASTSWPTSRDASRPWSCYVRLLSVRNPEAQRFYEAEALRGGWTVRQLDRQIGSQFYERTALSKNKAAMLRKGQRQIPDDVMTPEEEIKDPFFFEFLDLKDEYSEHELESALITKLEAFLLALPSQKTGDFRRGLHS